MPVSALDSCSRPMLVVRLEVGHELQLWLRLCWAMGLSTGSSVTTCSRLADGLSAGLSTSSSSLDSQEEEEEEAAERLSS